MTTAFIPGRGLVVESQVTICSILMYSTQTWADRLLHANLCDSFKNT